MVQRFSPWRWKVIWSAWVVAALLALALLDSVAFGVVVPVSGLVLAALPGTRPRVVTAGDHRDLLVIAGLYLGVVAFMRLAFVGFTTDHIPGLFLSFAAALMIGVIGPVVYSVWTRGRSLADLGVRVDNWQSTALLAMLFAATQFSLTLWGYPLPAAVDWVPLLVMVLVVGVFESVFFRGFIQTRLESQFGPVGGIAGAAALYGLYHVGYGMGGREMVFLAGLGVVYAVAFALTRNLLVLWPLLTPLGSFYANLEGGDLTLPWASIAGFADVFALMALALVLAHRHQHRQGRTARRGARQGGGLTGGHPAA